MNRVSGGNILLVHPEPVTLARLQSVVENLPGEWRVATAGDADGAVTAMEACIPDTLVSATSLQHRDGESLLARVRRSFPRVARLALHDGQQPSNMARFASEVQGIVARSCDFTGLRALIQRTHRLGIILSAPALEQFVGDLSRLPAVPRTYWELVHAARSPDATMQDVADIVQRDPAMTLRLLQLVNSAFFGFGRRIASIPQAVSLLGMDMVKGIALSAHLFAAMDVGRHDSFSHERFQDYALRSARLVRKFAQGSEHVDTAFTAALLRDIGQLAIAMCNPAGFDEITRRAAQEAVPFGALDQEILGVGHAEVGAHLLAKWEIPFPVVECVAFHHMPHTIFGPYLEVHALCHAADALLGIAHCGEPEDSLDLALIERSGFGDRLPAWRQMVDELRSPAT